MLEDHDQYVKNNPYKYIDPNGENVLGWCLGAGEMLLGGTLMVTGAFIEIGSFGTLTVAVGFQEAAGLSLIGHGFSQAMIHSRDISFSSSKTIESSIVMWENSTETNEKNNPFEGLVDEDVFIGDAEGNIIPVPEGQWLTGSKDGKWIQVKEPSDNGRGKPTGLRKDGGHPKSPKHPDPRAWEPHGHRPGVSNPDGTPWLPIY
ncbi:MAG: hypothetical protein K1060chlam5_01005 [Candidatus Anoxychlamydiales bacterium]|nr:hypothetical protein [Candidatus Anoxychlamydiales bacterium]